MKKATKSASVWLIIFVVIIAFTSFMNVRKDAVEEIPYSTLVSSIKSEQVKSMEISGKTAKIVLEDYSTGQQLECIAEIPSSEVLHQDIGEELSDQEERGELVVTYNEPKISLLSSFEIVFLIVTLIVFFVLFSKRGIGGGFTKCRAKLVTDK